MVLGMTGRGFATQIIKGFHTDFDTSACVSCGACVQTCPTEALTDKYETKTLRADKTVRTTCTYCGVGCQLDVAVIDGSLPSPLRDVYLRFTVGPENRVGDDRVRA